MPGTIRQYFGMKNKNKAPSPHDIQVQALVSGSYEEAYVSQSRKPYITWAEVRCWKPGFMNVHSVVLETDSEKGSENQHWQVEAVTSKGLSVSSDSTRDAVCKVRENRCKREGQRQRDWNIYPQQQKDAAGLMI